MPSAAMSMDSFNWNCPSEPSPFDLRNSTAKRHHSSSTEPVRKSSSRHRACTSLTLNSRCQPACRARPGHCRCLCCQSPAASCRSHCQPKICRSGSMVRPRSSGVSRRAKLNRLKFLSTKGATSLLPGSQSKPRGLPLLSFMSILFRRLRLPIPVSEPAPDSNTACVREESPM